MQNLLKKKAKEAEQKRTREAEMNTVPGNDDDNLATKKKKKSSFELPPEWKGDPLAAQNETTVSSVGSFGGGGMAVALEHMLSDDGNKKARQPVNGGPTPSMFVAPKRTNSAKEDETERCLKQLRQCATERVLVIDVETTGFSKDDEIIELAAVEVYRGAPTGVVFHQQVKPHKESHPMAQRVHQVTKAQLLKASPMATVMPNFIRFLNINYFSTPAAEAGEAALPTSLPIVVAHNAQFDMRMLSQEFSRLETTLNLDPSLSEVKVPGTTQTLLERAAEIICQTPALCTQKTFKAIYPSNATGSTDLDACCTFFGIDNSERVSKHTALVDANVTVELLLHLIGAAADADDESEHGSVSDGAKDDQPSVASAADAVSAQQVGGTATNGAVADSEKPLP